jgi:hypothetical protein
MAGNTDIDQSRIDETLAAYRELQSQFDRVRDRLRLAEENRHTVNRRIYERVRGEYDRELDAIRAKMSPLRLELETLRAGLEERVREARAKLVSVEEELAEAAFRHAVGEYSGDVIESKQRDLDARLAGARTSVEHLQDTLASLDATQNAETPDAAPEDLADEPASTPVVEAPRRPVLRATDLAAAAPKPAPPKPEALKPETLKPAASRPAPPKPAAPRPEAPKPAPPAPADRFENPQDWIDEVGRDPLANLREVTPREEPARRSAAADPSPVATATPERRKNAPSLVFVNGTHTGQSIPLLPTTLTIGREHDNNIEIKDAEVARYHARILHERGSYVVEDLESTTGTWVNGKRARRAVLNHGDVIKVGQTELAIDFEWATGAD